MLNLIRVNMLARSAVCSQELEKIDVNLNKLISISYNSTDIKQIVAGYTYMIVVCMMLVLLCSTSNTVSMLHL